MSKWHTILQEKKSQGILQQASWLWIYSNYSTFYEENFCFFPHFVISERLTVIRIDSSIAPDKALLSTEKYRYFFLNLQENIRYVTH